METEGVSYSAGRTVTIEDRQLYKGFQKFIIRRAMRPLFRMWLSMHMVFAPLPVFLPSQMGNVFGSHIFRPRGWDWVDPAKDVSANAEALRTGQTSLTRIAAQRGIDISELFAEIVAEREMARQAGLSEQEVSALFGLTDTTDAGNSDGIVQETQDAEP
jgi:capsid protein